MSTFTNQDQSHTADKPSCNSTSISLPTAVNLESRRSNKIQTQEQHQQQTTRKSNEIPPFDYSLLGPPPKTGFDWVKLIFRQYRALGTRYKTELIAGRTLSILVNWLPVSIYTNIQKFVQIRCPPTQMPSPPTQMMNDNKNNVSKKKKKKKKCGEPGKLQLLYIVHCIYAYIRKEVRDLNASVPVTLEGTFPRALCVCAHLLVGHVTKHVSTRAGFNERTRTMTHTRAFDEVPLKSRIAHVLLI